MSRVGKYPIVIPEGVVVTLREDRFTVQGQYGVLSLTLRPEISVLLESNKIWVKLRGNEKFSRAMWGTTRANIYNMIVGVSYGFSKRLDVVGIGYKVAMHGKTLVMTLGFSHDVKYQIPDDIAVRCESPTTLAISGASKERVGQIAMEIRSYRPPEPYKGKGIKYADEQLLRKEGKKK